MLECWKEKEQEKKRKGEELRLAHRLQWLMASVGLESSHRAEEATSLCPHTHSRNYTREACSTMYFVPPEYES